VTGPELEAAYGLGVGTQLRLFTVPELQAQLDEMTRELSTIRELLELLVDWAGARDRKVDDDPLESNL